MLRDQQQQQQQLGTFGFAVSQSNVDDISASLAQSMQSATCEPEVAVDSPDGTSGIHLPAVVDLTLTGSEVPAGPDHVTLAGSFRFTVEQVACVCDVLHSSGQVNKKCSF